MLYKSLSVWIVACILFQSTIHAQLDSTGLDDITKNILGKKVVITTIDNKKYKGNLIKIDHASVVIRQNKKEEIIALANVKSIRKPGNWNSVILLSVLLLIGLWGASAPRT